MYVGEVLGKRVAVQHLEMGGLVIWGEKKEEQGPSNAAKIETRASQAGLLTQVLE